MIYFGFLRAVILPADDCKFRNDIRVLFAIEKRGLRFPGLFSENIPSVAVTEQDFVIMRTSYDLFVLPAERTFARLEVLIAFSVVLIIKALVAVKPSAVIKMRARADKPCIIRRFYRFYELVEHFIEYGAGRMKFVAPLPHYDTRVVYHLFYLSGVNCSRAPAVFNVGRFGGIDKTRRPDIH